MKPCWFYYMNKIIVLLLLKLSILSLIYFLLSYQTIVESQAVFRPIDNKALALILIDRLKEKGLESPREAPEGITSLPSYPDAVYEAHQLPGFADPPVYVFRKITVRGKTLVSYRGASSDGSRTLLQAVVSEALMKRSEAALELFYNQVPSLSVGIPAGLHSDVKPVGLKSLDIPDPLVIRARLKPTLLLVIVGPTDGSFVDKPIYIYYYGFETTGWTFDNRAVKVTVVVSVVIDENKVIYEDAPATFGIAFFYYIGAYMPEIAAWPATTVFGYLGVVVSLFVFFVNIDEELKYYLGLSTIFILQIVLYFLINLVAGIEPNRIYYSAIILGPWFIALFVLWLPAYLLSTYKFYSNAEVDVGSSLFKAIFEGVSLSLIILSLIIMGIFFNRLIEAIIAYAGLGGFVLLILFLSFADLSLGYLFGKFWATMSRLGEVTSPIYRLYAR